MTATSAVEARAETGTVTGRAVAVQSSVWGGKEGYGLWAVGYELWAMNYGLWAMSYEL
jgi:hypothetical protein